MSKIKYQGTITKLLTNKAAKKNRALFERVVMADIQSVINHFPSSANIDIRLVSFSSKNDFPEQVLSILSFLRYVGKPASWTIYSDGTHTEIDDAYVKKNFPFVKLVISNTEDSSIILKNSLEPFRVELLNYANSKFPLGKKLFFYLNHPFHQPTLFLDSDVLFYCKAESICLLNEKNGWFLPEWIWGTLDNIYKQQTSQTVYQVNSGFFKADINADATSGLEYLKSLQGKYEYYTEQTVIHIILQHNNYYPLDPRVYFLNNTDQFDWSYNFKRPQIAIRHYTSPVRNKMWQRDWKWHLSI